MQSTEAAFGSQKKDSDEDVEKREWKSGLDTHVGLRHPHSHTSHPFHDARLYLKSSHLTGTPVRRKIQK